MNTNTKEIKMNTKTILMNMYCEVYYESKPWDTALIMEQVFLYFMDYIKNKERREYNLLPYKIAAESKCYSEGGWEQCKISYNNMIFRKCFMFRGGSEEEINDGMIRYMSEWSKLIYSAVNWEGRYKTFNRTFKEDEQPMDIIWDTWKRPKVRIIFEINVGDGKGFIELPLVNIERWVR